MTNYSPNSNSGRPLPLKETVRRMVESLANATAPSEQQQPSSTADEGHLSQDVIRAVIWAWQARVNHLPRELLADPAWGMLLELLRAELAGQRATVSTLCEASAAPETTAVRWLRALESHDLVVRRTDPVHPGNETFELTSKGSAAMRGYFRDILGNG